MPFIRKCPECGSINLYWNKETGEIICKDCNLVIEESMLNYGKDFRSFDEENKERSRAGGSSSLSQYDYGLKTEIGSKKDIYDISSKKMRDTIQRINVWHKRVTTAIERNLKNAMIELRRIVSFLKLTNQVQETAAKLYRDAVSKGLVRGRSMESVISSCVYAACRQHEVPRTLEELAEASAIDKKEIGRTYRFVTRELKVKILPSNPVDYIARFASELRLSPKTQTKSVEILMNAQHLELTSGRGPTGIAAAALYVASLLNGEKRTQREVAEIAGVTEVTIRNRYKEIITKLDLEKEIDKIRDKD
ncbi:MAG: TFIIB-type zinc ribbon-containing protein [Candidatus Nanoarchaeia archaeon]|nr:TFIIB-type zinc ribbon-containing protein [Candidatus Nanoarchaeia archaeon]